MTTIDAQALVLERHGAAAWIRLNRPKAMNALSRDVLDLLNRALDEIAADPEIRVVVLTGSGPAFCAGADLRGLSGPSGELDPDDVVDFVAYASRTVERLPALSRPVICGVNGLALAGGLELLLAADLVIASSSARIGDAHANYGLLPGAGGSVRLPRVLGTHRAKYLAFTGDFFPPSSPVLAGLVQEIVEPDALEARLHELAEHLAVRSPRGLAAMKRLIDAATDISLADALAAEQQACREHFRSADFREGLAAFAEKRPPRYSI
jgi:enoyl-CoA hydratase/carnithine racemase